MAASENPLCARLGRLLRECSLEAGQNGMVEDAKRVAEKVGIEYWNVEATCRRAEEELFGKKIAEDTRPCSPPLPDPVGTPLVRTRSVKFEETTPSSGSSPLRHPVGPGAEAPREANAPEEGPWAALPTAPRDPPAEDAERDQPMIKNTFLHLQEDLEKEPDSGPATCPLPVSGKRGSNTSRRSKGSEDSAKILEEFAQTPDVFETTPGKFCAWPFGQTASVFERSLRAESRRSSGTSRRSESNRGSLMQQVDDLSTTEGTSPEWFQPTPFSPGGLHHGGSIFSQRMALEVDDSTPVAAAAAAPAPRLRTAPPPPVDTASQPPLLRVPPAGMPPLAPTALGGALLPPRTPGGPADFMQLGMYPLPGAASPHSLAPQGPLVPPHLQVPPLMQHFGPLAPPPFGWNGFPGAAPSLPPMAPPQHAPYVPQPTGHGPPAGLSFKSGWQSPLGPCIAQHSLSPTSPAGLAGPTSDALKNRRRRGCKKARDPDRQEVDPLDGLPLWACVDLGALSNAANIVAGPDVVSTKEVSEAVGAA